MSSMEQTGVQKAEDEASRPVMPHMCTDKKMEEMAAAIKAVADAAKADKARQEWMETEIERQAARANAAELQKAALQDRVQQLEVALEEQGTKAALAWKWQQEVARLQEKLGKRSVELLGRDQDLEKLKSQMKEVASQGATYRQLLDETRETLAAREAELASSRKAHEEDVENLKHKLGKARDRIGVVETAYEDLREQATGEITDLRQKLAEMSDNLSGMSDRLKETNEQLAFTLAKRQSSRKKYNTLAEQLMVLSHSAAAASSSAGGGPAALLSQVPASPFETSGDTTSGSAREGCKAGALLTAPAHGNSFQSKPGAVTEVTHALQYQAGKVGFAAGGPGCVSIALSALSDDAEPGAAVHSSNSSSSSRGFKSSLGYAGVMLTGRSGSHTAEGPVTSDGSSKRTGMLDRLKTVKLASAVGAILSPRPNKKQARAEKQQQLQAGAGRGGDRHFDAKAQSAHDGFVIDGTSSRRCSSVTHKVDIPRKGEQILDAASASAINRRSTDGYCFSAADRHYASEGFGSHGRPGKTSSVSSSSSSRILSRAGSGISIAAYHPSLPTQDEGISTDMGDREKYASGLQTGSDEYLECSGGADDSSIASHFVPVDDSGSDCPA